MFLNTQTVLWQMNEGIWISLKMIS
jgi:hypothetical protein